MAPKKRRQAGKGATGGGRARRHRRPQGKRLPGATVGQREREREAEARRVLRIAEAGAAGRQVAEAGAPLAVALRALVEDTFRLLGTLVAAPFRIVVALRRLVAV